MRYSVRSSISCCRLIPRVRRVMSRTCVLNLSRAFGAMRRSLPSFEMLNPRNLRSSGRATALFASLTFSRSFWVRNRLTEAIVAHELRRCFRERAVVLDPLLAGQVEGDAAMDTALAEMSIKRAIESMLVQ